MALMAELLGLLMPKVILGEYDSLADMVSLAFPALVFIIGPLPIYKVLVWVKWHGLVLLFTAATALRLAKFNTPTLSRIKGKHYFFVSLFHCRSIGCKLNLGGHDHNFPMSKPWFAISMTILLISIAVLMLSNIPYRSFKDIDLKNSVRFLAFIVVLLVLMGVAMWPAELLLLIIVSYVLYGPVWALYRWFKKRSRKNKAHKHDE